MIAGGYTPARVLLSAWPCGMPYRASVTDSWHRQPARWPGVTLGGHDRGDDRQQHDASTQVRLFTHAHFMNTMLGLDMVTLTYL